MFLRYEAIYVSMREKPAASVITGFVLHVNYLPAETLFCISHLFHMYPVYLNLHDIIILII